MVGRSGKGGKEIGAHSRTFLSSVLACISWLDSSERGPQFSLLQEKGLDWSASE